MQWQLAKAIAPSGVTSGNRILIKGLSGALGAGIGAFVLYPLENVKIRQMVDESRSDEESQGMLTTIAKILREEGASGLFVGVVPYAVY